MRPTLVLLASLTVASARAQVAYDVFVEGVHPARVLVAADERHGEYRYGDDPAEVLALAGVCDALACKLTAVDSALSLRFARDPERLRGVMRLGDGRERVLVGTRRYDLVAPLRTTCADDRWLRAYESADGAYALALAAGPGGQLSGTLQTRGPASATSFAVRGRRDVTRAGQPLRLTLASPDGRPAGTFETSRTDTAYVVGALILRDASPMTLTLRVSHSLALECLQADGQRDLTYPSAGASRADVELGRRVRIWWRALGEADGDATGWFEPVRFDADYLSGWQHLRFGDGRAESHAVTVDRGRGRLLRGSFALSGSRREREALRTTARERAVAAHPLHDDPTFRAWADEQVFNEFAVAEGGLAFGGERHPVYGQLRWIEPWGALEPSRGFADLLPEWLTRWVEGVPSERE